MAIPFVQRILLPGKNQLSLKQGGFFVIKQSIRLVGGIIALFALILVFKHSHLMQEEKPLNTTERFNIAVLSTTISKERLVNELNALVDQYGAVLVKVVPNQDNYDSQKDIIWFGSLQPDGTSPRIRDNRISWLEPSVGGELIHSSDMGVRPLYGRLPWQNGATKMR